MKSISAPVASNVPLASKTPDALFNFSSELMSVAPLTVVVCPAVLYLSQLAVTVKVPFTSTVPPAVLFPEPSPSNSKL